MVPVRSARLSSLSTRGNMVIATISKPLDGKVLPGMLARERGTPNAAAFNVEQLVEIVETYEDFRDEVPATNRQHPVFDRVFCVEPYRW